VRGKGGENGTEKKKEKKEWFYIDRVAGSGGNHSDFSSDVIASTITGERESTSGSMYE